MTTEPALDKPAFVRHLEATWGLPMASLSFLPVGFDTRSFSYTGRTNAGQRLYVKVRQGNPALTAAAADVANRVIGTIPTLRTGTGGTSARWGDFTVTVSAFVEGRDGWNAVLSASQAAQVGAAVRSLHEFPITVSLRSVLPRERFDDTARAAVLRLLEDPAARSLVGDRGPVLKRLVAEARRLVPRLDQADLVCCHGDLHSGNLLLADTGAVHVVDWDTLSLAPREKDLMFPGAGIGGALDAPDAAQAFAEGYGPYRPRPDVVAYFRLERIVQDVVAFRELGTEHHPLFARMFDPGGVVDVALSSGSLL